MSLPEVAPPPEKTPQPCLLPEGSWLDLAGILLLGALFLSPILMSPHFGMFSDYGQILGWPARNIHGVEAFLHEFRPLADGRWTPMFHIITFGLYTLMGPSAFGFYLVQGLMLEASLAIVYVLTRWLASGSRAAGWTACGLILLSAPLAEDYFTLDKVEPRLVFFSLFSFGYFAWRLAGARGRQPVSGLETSRVFAAHFVAAVLIVFSKETGTFMVSVAFLALAAELLQKDRDPRGVREAVLFFTAMVAALTLYVWLSSALLPEEARVLRARSAGVGRYLNYGVTMGLVMENARGYLTWIGDTAVCVAVFGVWCAAGLWRCGRRDWDDRHLLMFLAGSGGCLYFAGMLLWRWMLLYYMLPAVVFLAVAVAAIAFDPRTTKLSRIGWPFAILLLLVLPLAARVPGRWRTAWTILAQDRSKDALVRALERQAASHSKFVMAMFDVRSAEIGQSLERYLSLDGYAGKTFVYNLVEGPWVNFGDKHRYDGSAAEPPTEEEMDAARALHSPFVIWRYKPQREIHRIWWMEPLLPGDLVMIPVGSPSNVFVQARGISAFSNSREAVVNTRFQGVRMKLLEEARVKVPLARDFLGWDLLEVTSVEAGQAHLAGLNRESAGQDLAALDASQGYLGSGWSQIGWTSVSGAQAEPFRWGFNGAQLLAPRTGAKVTLDLEPNGQLARLPIQIRALDRSGHQIASWALGGRMKVEFIAAPGEIVTLRLGEEIQVPEGTICFRLFEVGAAP